MLEIAAVLPNCALTVLQLGGSLIYAGEDLSRKWPCNSIGVGVKVSPSAVFGHQDSSESDGLPGVCPAKLDKAQKCHRATEV